jgi:threonine aldolase
MEQKLELDFRSDTVTKPCPQMREAMMKADVGDDYYRDDPTVRDLECFAADLFGKDAALLTPSGTQSNLIAVLSHCQRGEAYIVGHRSHSYLRELGGVATVAGVQPQVVHNKADGTLRLEDVEASVFPPSILFAPVRLIAIENTMDGLVLPLAYLKDISNLAAAHALKVHMDGARIFNAAVALNCPVPEIASYCDTISFCLSKGLGAPIGSMLVGSRAVIETARRHRQMLGGGLRQAGIIAAAGLFALQNNVSRLKHDHARAKTLATALSRVRGLTVDTPQTNMVFCNVDAALQESFARKLKDARIQVSGTPGRQRWVTHLDINDAALASTVNLLGQMQDVCHAH